MKWGIKRSGPSGIVFEFHGINLLLTHVKAIGVPGNSEWGQAIIIIN